MTVTAKVTAKGEAAQLHEPRSSERGCFLFDDEKNDNGVYEKLHLQDYFHKDLSVIYIMIL